MVAMLNTFKIVNAFLSGRNEGNLCLVVLCDKITIVNYVSQFEMNKGDVGSK